MINGELLTTDDMSKLSLYFTIGKKKKNTRKKSIWVAKFKCLGAICVDRRIEEEVTHMLHEGREIWRMLRELRKENTKSLKIKRQLYEKVVISTVVYGSDT